MSAFGHKQSFRFYAYTCILTVNERLLSAISRHQLDPNTTILNVCFGESGRSLRVETPPKRAGFMRSNQVKADASLTSGGLD